MSTTNLFTYVNDANIEGFLANEQDYEDKISFLGTTKKIRAKGKEYGGEDNIIESISINGVAEEITNKNVDISVPTKVSDLVNDSGFINEHQDISGKQDVITDLATIRSNASTGAAKVSANDSTITIQKGGSTVDTFTTNAASNKTINIPNELPSYLSSDSGKILSVNSSGQLVWITPAIIYTGSGEPNNSTGNDGDIYLQQ